MRPNFKIGAAIASASALVAVGGIAVAGAADPGLEAKIDSAESEASLISQRISSQSAQISELEAEAAAAAAREAELQSQLRDATARSSELSDDLLAAERELEVVRARYDRSVGVLADRLVAIYKSPDPDLLAVILEASDYAEIQSRAEYVEALTDADQQIAERVTTLREEVDGRYEEISGIKDGIDQQSRRLDEAQQQIAAEHAAAAQRADEIAAARADAEGALAELQQQISGWELEVRKAAAAEISEGGDEAFLGGPYSDPDLHRDVRVRRQLRRAEPLERRRRRVPDHPVHLARLRRPGPPARGLQGRAGPHRGDHLARGRPRRLVLRMSVPSRA